jgi:hypothetical protein
MYLYVVLILFWSLLIHDRDSGSADVTVAIGREFTGATEAGTLDGIAYRVKAV